MKTLTFSWSLKTSLVGYRQSAVQLWEIRINPSISVVENGIGSYPARCKSHQKLCNFFILVNRVDNNLCN